MSSAQGQDPGSEALREKNPEQPEGQAQPAATAPSGKKKKKKKVDPLIGRHVGGRYTITKRIGAGGMGVVYKAKQGAVDRDVAIKVLLTKPSEDDEEYDTLVRRFHLEARAASRLSHPNTITIYDFGNDEGLLYIAMEFLDGTSLDQALKKGALSTQRTTRIIMQLCHSLSEAHKNNIIHRDIKPDNIFLVGMGGDNDFVKVLDFGVAKIRGPSNKDKTLTKAGMIFGTPKYMSPEQARCMPLDSRSDVYSVGVMMYQMLMGTVPFDADDHVSILLMHCSEPPEPFSKRRPDLQIPPEIEAIVFKAMMKDRDARYQSIDEMAAALEVIASKYQFVANTAMMPIVSGYSTSANPAITPIPGAVTPPPTQATTLGGADPTGFNLADTIGPDPTSMDLSVDASVAPSQDPSGSVENPSTPLMGRPNPDEVGLTASGSYKWDGDLKLDLGPTPRHGSQAVNARPESKLPIGLIVGAAVVALIVVLIAGFFLFSGDKNDEKPDKPPITKDKGDDGEKKNNDKPNKEEEGEDKNLAANAADAGTEGEDEGSQANNDTKADAGAEAVAENTTPDAAQAKQDEPPEEVTIKITSEPSGAKVFVNNKPTEEVTPATLKRPYDEKKTMRVSLKLRGYRLARERVALNEDAELNLKLKKATRSNIEKEADGLFGN